jgi:hypothetical protein
MITSLQLQPRSTSVAPAFDESKEQQQHQLQQSEEGHLQQEHQVHSGDNAAKDQVAQPVQVAAAPVMTSDEDPSKDEGSSHAAGPNVLDNSANTGDGFGSSAQMQETAENSQPEFTGENV